jgi:signal-transduction protein with cAMP-binding, CBS, and nucleotidyltransferase domain
MKIKEITVRPPVTASADTTILQAARLMSTHAVGSLIITAGERLLGIVTDRDLVVRALARGLPSDARVDDVMSMNVIALDAEADVRDAMSAFGHHAVRRLPIVDHGKVTGLLALDDLVIALAGQFGEVTTGLTAQLLFPHAFDEAGHPAAVE